MAYTPAQRKAIASLPDGFLLTSANIYGHVSGQRIQLTFYKDDETRIDLHNDWSLRRNMPVSYKSSGNASFIADANTDFAKDYEVFLAARKDHGEQLRQAGAQGQALLASVGTVEALLDVWPECAPFIPKAESAAARSLPVVSIGKLNTLFDLPVEEVAKAA